MTKDLLHRALVDCGTSNNFFHLQSLESGRLNFVEREIPSTRMTVRLATGASISVKKRVVGIHCTLEGEQYDHDFIVLDLDGKFDVILGLSWLRRYELSMIWHHRSVMMPETFSSDDHMMNVLVHPQACGCTASEYDGLTYDKYVTMTLQDCSVVDEYTV